MSALEDIFSEALDRPAAERAAFVHARCAGDAQLQARVERLLLAHGSTAPGFLATPAVEALGPPTTSATLGRYAMLHELGRGGMGVVWAAYDGQLDRKVAVKVVREDRAHPDARARLELEAKALAKLQHPNVVAVHDVGDTGGNLFIAMELVEGPTLSTWAKGRPWDEVLRALLAAGRGLAHAHRAGVLHRDFKPANVLIDESGRARVADFGLAASVTQAREGNAALRLTEPGAPMGTAGYMAPELLAGRPASVASDVFAFSRSIEKLVQGGPEWLQPMLRRGLAEDPAARWPNVDSLLLAIETELGTDPKEDPRPARRQRRLLFAVFAAVVLGVPVAVFAGPVNLGTPVEVFWMGLAPAALMLGAVGVFWPRVRVSPYTRRAALTLLAMLLGMALNRGLGVLLEVPVPAMFAQDLLLFAVEFAVAAAISQRWMLWGSAVSLLGAGAVALFPAYTLGVFTAATLALLPIGLRYWAVRESDAGVSGS